MPQEFPPLQPQIVRERVKAVDGVLILMEALDKMPSVRGELRQHGGCRSALNAVQALAHEIRRAFGVSEIPGDALPFNGLSHDTVL